MPIYEYRCTACGKRSSILVLSVSNAAPMSRFAAPKSEEARLESLADPSKFGDLDENDPQSMARFMKRMGQEMGEDLGDDFEESLEDAAEEPAGADTTDLD
jgi:hypothetical protein